MAKKAVTCPTVLRQLLRYEPETGKLFWRPRARAWFMADRDCKGWNTRYAGKEAFTSGSGRGYKSGAVLGVGYEAHRLIIAITEGRWPQDEVDHINGIRDDNRLSNLRAVSRAENFKNKRVYGTNKTGHTGVSWHKAASKWAACIRVGGKGIHLGTFDDINDAIAARKAAEAEHGFHENHGRAA